MNVAEIEQLSLKLANVVGQERELTGKLEAIRAQKAEIIQRIAHESTNGNGAKPAAGLSKKAQVLELLRSEDRAFSVGEISTATGVAANAVSAYAGELVGAGVARKLEKGMYAATK